ncbi:uncharacterized protein UDID_19321 [Ustilago sp. UG-2017a]|nr:uncharacterized protein UDID_19321 [Ustilago sp. UG-2017a]
MLVWMKGTAFVLNRAKRTPLKRQTAIHLPKLTSSKPTNDDHEEQLHKNIGHRERQGSTSDTARRRQVGNEGVRGMTNEANFQINARNTVANRSTPHLFLYPSATATLDRVYNFWRPSSPNFSPLPLSHLQL